MEFFHNPAYEKTKEVRIVMIKPFPFASRLLQGCQAIVLHNMPIHTGYEIEREVVEAHNRTILQQGENRRHVAKEIFLHLFALTM